MRTDLKRITALVLVLIMAAGLFAGCDSQKSDIQEEFFLMVVEAASTKGLTEAVEYLEANLGKVDEESADHMVSAYVEYLYRYIATNPDRLDLSGFLVYYDAEEDRISEDLIGHSEFQGTYETLSQAHLMITKFEDKLVMKTNYTSIIETYGEEISESLMALYRLNARTVEAPMTENATLMISWKEVLDRAATAEGLLADYGDDEHQHITEDALWLYKTYISMLLMGATNSPIFSYEDGHFSQEADLAYHEYMKREPAPVLAEILDLYFEYLESVDYTMHYSDETESQRFFETCDYLLLEAEKRALNGNG